MLPVVIITLAVMGNFYFFLFAYLYFRYPFTMTMYHCYSFPHSKKFSKACSMVLEIQQQPEKNPGLFMELYFGYEGTDFKIFN